ncbi:MAG: hypothetical protein R3F54_23535 [Alphaproteobacteria bacterium]
MSVTVVNDYYFKPDGDIREGKAAAADLVAHFEENVPEVQLSLWLACRENPLHHFHITVYDNPDVLAELRDSDAIKRFTDRLYPHIDHSTFVYPVCDVWLAGGRGVETVGR